MTHGKLGGVGGNMAVKCFCFHLSCSMISGDFDPNENKYNIHVFLRDVAYFMYVHVQFSVFSASLLIFSEGLVYQIALQQISANYCQS